MQKINKFSDRVNKETAPIFENFFKNPEYMVVFGKRMRANLLGERLPDDHLPIGPISKKESYLSSIFRKYYEVNKSVERMKLCRIFISKASNIKSISKLDYIMYHYEYYLNEMYIYNTRVNQLLDFIIKECHRTKMLEEIAKVEATKRALNKAMKNITTVRGLHVHKKRYNTDKVSQLSELELLSDKFEFIRAYGRLELKKFKKKILSGMEGNINTFEKFIEETIYEEIGELIFDKILLAK